MTRRKGRKSFKTKGQKPKASTQEATRTVSGSISLHQRGFGFVKDPPGPDVFIPKTAALGAVDGDVVEIEVLGNPGPKGPEGRVIQILKRGRTHIAGTIVGKSGRHYTAFSPLLGPDKGVVVRSKDLALQEGDRVICRVLNWNNDVDLVEAMAEKRIGHISDASVDIDAAIAEFNLADAFAPAVIAEAKAFGTKVTPDMMEGRHDLTHLESVTIDPDTARDFDDAISLTQDDNGHFHLGVHIADVAHYVKSGSHLDKEAESRCNSTYFPGRCVPMLPEALSNELCSLKPKVIRLTQSVLAEFTPSGDLVRFEVVRSAIRSHKRFTYKEALAVIEKQKKSVHAPLLNLMVDFCLVLKKKRMERGSIDFAMPDNVVIVNAEGVPERLERVEYDITHQMIEEFMLKANELVAISLDQRGKTLIYRVHEEPSSDAFQDFYALARSLGFHLPAAPTHRDIQKLFQEAKDSPFGEQLSVQFIRSMKLAAYSPANIGHYGLALNHYCHFTSPIRRYSDLIIQRLLFDELDPNADLEGIAAACSEKERISFRAESSVVLLKKLRLSATYLEAEPTKVYRTVITKVKPFALFFEVSDFGLEGSIHVSKLGNEYFEFHPKQLSFRGSRSGRIYSSGKELFVQLLHVDCIFLKSEWSIVAPPTTKARHTEK